MSEELTKERLDQMEDLLHTSTTSNEFYTKRLEARERVTCLAMIHLPALLSMARRTLEVEERLRKAVEALQIYSECACTSMYKCGRCRVIDEDLLGGPEDLHPPAQCAPPEGTDVPPDMELTKAVNLLNDGSFPLGGNATLIEGRWWFRHDTEDSTTQANEDVLRDLITPELAEYGLELEDPCIEHDCISGFLKLIEDEPDPTLEAMRKGLDDHSCNSTGWEKP